MSHDKGVIIPLVPWLANEFDLHKSGSEEFERLAPTRQNERTQNVEKTGLTKTKFGETFVATRVQPPLSVSMS